MPNSTRDLPGAAHLNGQLVSNLVWSSATLNRRNTELLDAITPYAVRMCQDRDSGETTPESINEYFKQQAIGNLLWSCAVMDHFPVDLMRLLYRGIVGEGSEQQLDFMSRFHEDIRSQVGYFQSLLYVSIFEREMSSVFSTALLLLALTHSLDGLVDRLICVCFSFLRHTKQWIRPTS